jgi:hypothetical protein
MLNNRGGSHMVKLTASMLTTIIFLCIGCTTAGHNYATYEVTGQVLDAATSEPFENARITVDLQRDGVSIEFLGRPTVVRTIAAGVFETFISADSQSGFGSLPPVEFGSLPNEIQVIVRTESGVGIAIVSIAPEDIVELFPDYRSIQLPTIKVVVSTEITDNE